MIHKEEFTRENIDRMLDTMRPAEIRQYFRVRTERITNLIKQWGIRSYIERRRTPKEKECDFCHNKFEKKRGKNTKHIFCSKECSYKFAKGIVGEANPRYKRNEIQCSNCETKMYVTNSHLKTRKTSFCCKNCYAEWRSKNLRKENNWNYIKDAPRKANGKIIRPLAKVEVSCVFCQNLFLTNKANLSGSKYGNFCSKKCFGNWRTSFVCGHNHPSFKNGRIDYYGDTWPMAKKTARLRDNNTCQICGATKEQNRNRQMDVHHKIPFRNFPNHILANQIDNLVALCARCHKSEEHKSYRQREQYLMSLGEEMEQFYSVFI